jgi:hypothetical protein
MRTLHSAGAALLVGLGAIAPALPALAFANLGPPPSDQSGGYNSGYQTNYCPPPVHVRAAYHPAPPPLRSEYQPPVPGPNYVWTPGYWGWNDTYADYYWVPGVWVLPPAIGLLWTPGYWAWGGGGFVFNVGYWGPSVGFYGGINYGFGYTGYGYSGGYWNGNNFYYNRTVNNITNSNITTVYNQAVSNTGMATRVSYNGGPGGVTARPTSQQLAAARTARMGATPGQTAHAQAAAMNPSQRAGLSHGRMATAGAATGGWTHGGRGAFSGRGYHQAHSQRGVAGRSAGSHAYALNGAHGGGYGHGGYGGGRSGASYAATSHYGGYGGARYGGGWGGGHYAGGGGGGHYAGGGALHSGGGGRTAAAGGGGRGGSHRG